VLSRHADNDYRDEKRYRTDECHNCFSACFHARSPANSLHLPDPAQVDHSVEWSLAAVSLDSGASTSSSPCSLAQFTLPSQPTFFGFP
jgi:hypothetical protein